MDQEIRKCFKCLEEKSLRDFNTDSRRADGLNCWCKVCTRAYAKKRIDKMIVDGLRPERKYTLLSDEVKQEILNLYHSGVGSYRIAKMLGRSKTAVLDFLRSEGIIRTGAQYRKYKFTNENYFDKIDSDDKAYFLGLLWADGCNYRNDNKKTRAYQIHLALQERDEEVLNFLAEKMFGSTDVIYKIDHSKKKPVFISGNKKATTKFRNVSLLKICSKHVSDLLNSYGMTPKKSITLNLPSLVKNDPIIFRSFVRGYFDGDGWLARGKEKTKNGFYTKYSCGMIGSDSQMEEMRKMFSDFGFKFSIRKQFKMSVITIYGNYQVSEFLKWMYADATVKLSRKYNTYLDLLEQSKGCKNSKLSKLTRLEY